MGIPNDQQLHVFRLATLGELATVRSHWNSLYGGIPFRSWEWLDSWWRYYGNRHNDLNPSKELFSLAVFTSMGDLVGLAPWYVERTARHGRVIRFLGSGEVCSDYLSILSQPGYERAVGEAVADWLAEPPHISDWLVSADQQPWDLLELNAISPDDIAIARLLEVLAQRDYIVHRQSGPNCWRIDLPPSWEEYLAMLSKSHRKQIRRCERKYFQTGRAQIRHVHQEDELAACLELLTDLHERRRIGLGERGAFASTRFTAFHQEITARLLRRGELAMCSLEVDGRAVAAEYQIAGRHAIYAYQSGVEPKALEHEPGRLITIATLRQAIAEGRTACDFLRGDESYKAHWRAKPRLTENIRVVQTTGKARLRHSLWLASGNVKNWIKGGLKLSRVKS